jgi:hypothetical protein
MENWEGVQSAEDFYPIVTIQPEWILEDEAMGSKQKFWFRDSRHRADWLFKYPQTNTGQHWAEKIAEQIAVELHILHAKVELAVFQTVQGSASESFARKGRELFHGNQVLAGQVLGYDPGKRFRQANHTLENILSALDRVFVRPETARASKQRIAGYLVLDALIGNTDRHHENWGILLKRTRRTWIGMVAPSFDHASSLGRELLDDGDGKCRRRLLNEHRVGAYAEKAPGAIYWDSSDKRAVSPLDLIRRSTSIHPSLFRPVFARLDMLQESTLSRILARVPPGWMSEEARRFAMELTCYNLKQLKKIPL